MRAGGAIQVAGRVLVRAFAAEDPACVHVDARGGDKGGDCWRGAWYMVASTKGEDSGDVVRNASRCWLDLRCNCHYPNEVTLTIEIEH